MNKTKRVVSLVLIGAGATAAVDGLLLAVLAGHPYQGGFAVICGLCLLLAASMLRRLPVKTVPLSLVTSALCAGAVVSSLATGVYETQTHPSYACTSFFAAVFVACFYIVLSKSVEPHPGPSDPPWPPIG